MVQSIKDKINMQIKGNFFQLLRTINLQQKDKVCVDTFQKILALLYKWKSTNGILNVKSQFK